MPIEIRTRTVEYTVQVNVAATATTPAESHVETRFRVESFAVEVADPHDTRDDNIIPPEAVLVRAADYEDTDGDGLFNVAQDGLLEQQTYDAGPTAGADGSFLDSVPLGSLTGEAVQEVGEINFRPAALDISTPEQFVEALFSNQLANAYIRVDISVSDSSNAVYQALYAEQQRRNPTVTDPKDIHNLVFRSLQEIDFSSTVFAGNISYANFIGANLSGAQFLAPVSNTTFLYANLSGAHFYDAVRMSDFAFSGITNNPFLVSPENSTLTGTRLARRDERIFGQPVMNPSEQSRLIDLIGRDRLEAWTAGTRSDPDVFTMLRDQGIDMNGRLSTSWRSFLYDNLGAIREDGDVKPLIFDAIDGRYGERDFVPTLQSLYDFQFGGVYIFRDLINRGLAQGLLNDNGPSIDDPYNRAATPLIMQYTRVDLGFDEWLDSAIDWNAQDWPVDTIAIPLDLLDRMMTDPSLTPEQRADIERRADDGIVTLRDLAGIPGADRLLYSYLGGR